MRARLVDIVLAIAAGLAAGGCGHRVPTKPPAAPVAREMWGFSADVREADLFCVPTDTGGLACITVAELRWFVQNFRKAQ